jgi:predicted O-linked N-acetylglucosamine transferase (SPINDLY family)
MTQNLFFTAVKYHQTGDLAQAEPLYRQVLALTPNHADTLRLLGTLLHQQKRLAEAVECYQVLLQLRPDNVEVHYNLGLILSQQQQWAAAIAEYNKVLQLQPNFGAAHFQLGMAYQAQGQGTEAIYHYEQAIQLQPDLAMAHNNLGVLYQQQGLLAEAIAYYNAALRYQPDFAEAYHNLGGVLQLQGQPDEAVAAFEQSLHLQPRPEVRLKMALTLPVIYDNIETMHHWRQRLTQQIATLQTEQIQIEPTADTVSPNFLLAYHGLNDLEIQQTIGQFFDAKDTKMNAKGAKKTKDANSSPFAPLRASSYPSRLRVGFVSKYFRSHTIGLLNRGFIAQLSRAKFEVVVFSLGHHDDPIAAQIQQHADIYVELPDDVTLARQMIAAQNLDILYYTDLGMEPLSYALALHRLAPVQCVTWGHPVTSGLETIDYFISSELYETAASDQHYSEKLIRLARLNTYYYRPQSVDSRRQTVDSLLSTSYRLPSTTYLCPQSLFKLHPDFDPILAEILRQDPQGQLHLLSGLHSAWNELLLRRFRRTMPEFLDRIHFVPRLTQPEFLQLLATADVILDTIHFCGGNTSLEAFAVGTPIVTMPSSYLRGRLTYGFYQKMGLLDCVALNPSEYVAIAIKLGTDPAYRAHLKAEILARNHLLYEDLTAVHELEQFLEAVS